jgi:potassium efflux system protein
MTTVCQYVIVGLGIVLAFNAIGIGWSKVQWLIAAMSLGLGFGLQEIFANFVSGLIILFERPIRVGDIITIGDVSGVVTRIRIRATTVRDWDRKELVVPNKEFITGRLLNWTLTDAINRIVINVGVAYGSDTERARELLLEVARSHPATLDDPAPFATFEGFGDSALTLVMRCFLPNLQNRLEVIHELHTDVDRAFKEAGIEIAFPQRDLHLRTVPGGAEKLLPATPDETSSPAPTAPAPPRSTTPQAERRSGVGPSEAPDSEISDGM